MMSTRQNQRLPGFLPRRLLHAEALPVVAHRRRLPVLLQDEHRPRQHRLQRLEPPQRRCAWEDERLREHGPH